MQLKRFIACRGPIILGALLVAGAVNAQDAVAPEDVLIDAKVEAQATTDPQPQSQGAMGSAIGLQTLGDMRGGTEVVDNDIWVNGRVEDAIAEDVLTGNNSLSSGSFANASGISTVIQNTGANVLIQNAMIVNVKFADPSP
ncbi:hypothetical protein [Lysobacter panacisoli]|uniref:Uncharacterized protein n=1 Tax=Lysobacter panacisoli TaxID=1255263 RepID=A0ABP9LAG9_9GAMM|nr:hypothetical protein [Lysobacter panacisoli]